jgi:hypothetical protein
MVHTILELKKWTDVVAMFASLAVVLTTTASRANSGLTMEIGINGDTVVATIPPTFASFGWEMYACPHASLALQSVRDQCMAS